MALKYLVSSEVEGERNGGSVVNKVGSDISREALQEGSLQEEARLMTNW